MEKNIFMNWVIYFYPPRNMAMWKKWFLLYADLKHTVEKMTDEDAWLLLKHILGYVNDENPDPPNMVVDLVFEPIKQTLKRDLTKREKRAERSRENGKRWWRPKNPKKPRKTQKTQQVILEPRKPVSDNVNVNVNDTVNESNDLHIQTTNVVATPKKENQLLKKFWEKNPPPKKTDTPKQEFWNADVNALIATVETACLENWFLYSWKWKRERQACTWLLSKKHQEKLDALWMDMATRINFVVGLSKTSKYMKQLTSVELIYYNWETVVNKASTTHKTTSKKNKMY